VFGDGCVYLIYKLSQIEVLRSSLAHLAILHPIWLCQIEDEMRSQNENNTQGEKKRNKLVFPPTLIP
jgi:hypothetical protein